MLGHCQQLPFVQKCPSTRVSRIQSYRNRQFGTQFANGMYSRAICIIVVSVLWCSSLSLGFDDPISVIGRIKWNYTKYEENLWNFEYSNTTIPLIYRQHIPFLLQTIGVENSSLIALNSTEYIPFVASVYDATVHVDQVWEKYANFSRWFSNKRIEAEVVSSIEEIPALEEAINSLWNKSTGQIYSDFFRKKSFGCKDPATNNTDLPVYQLVEDYFTESIATQLKCYILLQLAYLTEAATDFTKYQASARTLRAQFNARYTKFTQETEVLIWGLSRGVWNCDPSTNASYTMLTNFIQGYVDNKINMNAAGSCSPQCKDLKETKNYDCNKNTLCGRNYLDSNKTRCNGVIRDCDFFDSGLTYCANEDDKVPERRIDYIRLDSGDMLGEEKFCPDKVHLKSWYYWLSSCSYCFCYCDAPGPTSDRHFSLREVVSNIAENRVISGIQLVKKNGIIHLHATERELLVDANLNKSESWALANDNFTVDDVGVKEGVDFYTLTYENRTLNLDEIAAARDQLVTGVRFRVINGRLQLQARFTYFDDSLGKLDIVSGSDWLGNSNTDRELLQSDHSYVPTKSPAQTLPLSSKNGNYVEFGPTGWVHDMAQNTVPFFDTQPLETSSEPVALHGVGLIYKAWPGHAGYVAPKLIAYDYAMSALRIRGAVGVHGI